MGGHRSKLRTLVEAFQFEAEASELTDRQLDAAAGLLWGIARNPTMYPEVPGYKGVRLAKSWPVETEDGEFIPAVRIWFSIRDNDDECDLLAIEAETDEELG